MSNFSFSEWFEDEIYILFESDADELKSYLVSENITSVSRLEVLDVNNLPFDVKRTLKAGWRRAIKSIRGNLINV
jgi:hypothetical protein